METITGLRCVALCQNGKKQEKKSFSQKLKFWESLKGEKSTGMAGMGKSSPRT
jgi:hypothetical protein